MQAKAFLQDLDFASEFYGYAARLKAGHTIPLGRGVWVPLYITDSDKTPSHVGGGAGLVHPAIKRVPLNLQEPDRSAHPQASDLNEHSLVANQGIAEAPLTIPEAKRRLGLTLGVDPSHIRITVEA